MCGKLDSIELLYARLNRFFGAIFFSEVDLRISSANETVRLSVCVV
jgi:hypothetical protein